MTIKRAKIYKGQYSYASMAQDGPYPDFGERPVVGQMGRAYNHENGHGIVQRRTRTAGTAGEAPASGPIPTHSRGWPVDSPSEKE